MGVRGGVMWRYISVSKLPPHQVETHFEKNDVENKPSRLPCRVVMGSSNTPGTYEKTMLKTDCETSSLIEVLGLS